MISKFAFTATGLLVALCLVSPTFAAPVVIDTFSTPISTFDGDGSDASPGADGVLVGTTPGPDAEIKDGERDYSMTATTFPTINSDGSSDEPSAFGSDLQATFFEDATDISALILVYDGVDVGGFGTDDTTDTLPISLDPSLDVFVLEVWSVSGTFRVDVIVHDDDDVEGTSTTTFSTPGAYFFPLVGFGGGIDWTALNWIKLDFTGIGESNVELGLNHFEVQSLPEPSSFALLSLGALGLCARRLRRRKGSADTAA